MSFLKILLSSVCLCLMFTSLTSQAQVHITSYSVYALGVGTNKMKPVSGELKIFANGLVENVQTEVNLFYNFKSGVYHKFSVGAGINFVPFKSYDQVRSFTLPLALEVFPLQEFKSLSLMVEVAPEIMVESNMRLRHLWGIRYTF